MEDKKVKKKRVHKTFHTCEKCDYTDPRKTNVLAHYLANHATLEEKREKYTYYCKYCEVGSLSKTSYENHLKSRSHKKVENAVAMKEQEQEIKT